MSNHYEREVDGCLGHSIDETSFIVTRSGVTECISKLQKKTSCGVDDLCAKHLRYGFPLLIEHLTLLFQMIFCCCIVPDLFSSEVITPVLKRGKPSDECSSFRPIMVSPVLCKVFELLIIDEISDEH